MGEHTGLLVSAAAVNVVCAIRAYPVNFMNVTRLIVLPAVLSTIMIRSAMVS